ncbi:hypothetical protein Tco_0031580 [Tanacetum coccineum]
MISHSAVNLWTRNLVIRQRVEDFQLGIKSYQTQLNLTKPRWDATGFEFKHDFTVIDSPRAVTFRDKYGALEYRSRNSRSTKMNRVLNTWFGDKERCRQNKEFMFCLQENGIRQEESSGGTTGKLCWWKDQRGRLQYLLKRTE